MRMGLIERLWFYWHYWIIRLNIRWRSRMMICFLRGHHKWKWNRGDPICCWCNKRKFTSR